MASAQEANPAPDLSVVIPVYNEAHRIGESVATVAAWLRSRIEAGTLTAGEIVVVSDGSRDDPGSRLSLGSDGGVETRFIEFPENRGKGAAVRAGVLAATGRTILFSDADLATPIEESTKLERALDEGADLAIASRRVDDSDIQVEQSTSRQLTGGLFPRVVRLLTGLRHADTLSVRRASGARSRSAAGFSSSRFRSAQRGTPARRESIHQGQQAQQGTH